MKRLLGIVLALAMLLTLVSVVPSFADPVEWVNIDWIDSTDGSGNQINLLTGAKGGQYGVAPDIAGAMLGELSDDVAAGAQFIHFIGWYMPLKELADVGVSIDGGELVYGGYMVEEQGLYEALASFDNVGYVRRINFYYPIQEGSHTLDVVAKFADDSEKTIFSTYYTNGGNIALNKPVYSSISTVPAGGACFNSNNEFWNINYINDGSATLFVGTSEPLGWYAASATPDVESRIIIDLEGQYAVNRVELLSMGFNNSAFPNTYQVLASADGITWYKIGQEEGVAANFFTKRSSFAADVTARYIQIYVTKFNLVDVYYAGLGEVEVFGSLVEEDNTKSIFEPFTSYDPGTAATADPGGNAAWVGYSTGDLDFEFTFRTDVSFWKIGFPGFWSAAATPLTFTFYQDETPVHSFDYTTTGDGAIALDIGATLPAGKYTCVITINDDSVNGETGYYNKYMVLGYATAGKLLDEEYFTFERGKIAFDIYSDETEGEGLIKLLDPAEVKCSIDALAKEDAYLSISTNYNTATSVTINEGESLRLLGWITRTYTNLEKIVYTVGGGDEIDCEDAYRSRTEIADIIGVDPAYLQNSGFGLDNNLLDLTGIESLTPGDYTIKVIAKFADGNTYDLKEFTLTVEAVDPEAPTWVTTGKIVNTDTFAIVNDGGAVVNNPSNKTELGQLKSIVGEGGTKIKQYGWVYPEKAILTIGYMNDDGEITWGIEYYDQAIVDVFNGQGLPNAALALRFDTSRQGNAPILEGDHTYKLVVMYSDHTLEVLHSATYSNSDELVAEWVANNPSSANTVGLWLNEGDSYAMAAFTANAPFEAVKFPAAWSSKTSEGKTATFEVALYAFVNNFEESVAGEPIAILQRSPAGDEATGYGLEFEEQPAGQYVLVVRIVDLDAGAYTVLPVLGDSTKALYNLNKAKNADSFNFTVKTKYPTDFFGEVPVEVATPPHEPVTRDFDAAEGDALSYDQILVNGSEIANGNANVIAAKQLIDGSDGSITSVSMHGWYGNANLAIDQFGYMIDGGEPVFGEFKVATEDGVLTAGGPYASRFTITVDTAELPAGSDHTVRAVAKLENGDIVILNRVDNPGEANEKDRDVYFVYRPEAPDHEPAAYRGFIDSLGSGGTISEENKAANPTKVATGSFYMGKGSDSISFRGWAISLASINSYKILINDEDVTATAAFSFSARDDVIGAFAGEGYTSATNPTPGFAVTVPVNTLDFGSYTVEVFFTDGLDDEYKLAEFTLTIEDGAPIYAEALSVKGSSLDTVYFDEVAKQDGNAHTFLDSYTDRIINKDDEGFSTISFRGWVGYGSAIDQFGYSINGVETFGEFKQATEPGVLAAGGDYASRFKVDIPVGELTANADVKAIAKLEGGQVVDVPQAYCTIAVNGGEHEAVTRDFDAAEGDALSYDQILVNGTEVANGNSAVIATKQLIADDEGTITSVSMHGWYGNANLAIDQFGYTVDGGEPVFGDFKVATEDAVYGVGGEFASRFTITVDVSEFAKGKVYKIQAVAKLENGDIVILNRFDNPGTDNEKDRDIYVNFRTQGLEGFSLDALSTNNTYPAATNPNYNVAESFSINQGEKLYVLGWAYRTYTNLSKVVYRIANGDDIDATGSYRSREDVAGVFGVDAEWFTNSGFGLDTGLLELTGIEDLEPGTYRLRVVAIFEDDSRLKMIDTQMTIVGSEEPGEEGTAVINPEDVEIVPGEDVVIGVPESETPIDTVVISGEVVGAIVAGIDDEANVDITLSGSTVTLDKNAINAIVSEGQPDDEMTISIKIVEKETLNDAQKAAIEDKDVAIVIDAEAKIGGVIVHDLNGGTATIEVPFVLDEGIDPDRVKVAYVSENGEVEIVDAVYSEGTLKVTVSHFSTFVSFIAPLPVIPPTSDAGIFATVIAVVMAGALVAMLAIKRRKATR